MHRHHIRCRCALLTADMGGDIGRWRTLLLITVYFGDALASGFMLLPACAVLYGARRAVLLAGGADGHGVCRHQLAARAAGARALSAAAVCAFMLVAVDRGWLASP
ncbi:hypothetical protein AVEN_241894-1 [Araneus ventricosus]|uniref:Uncharacterized protein n=1 Tax=Araneus ventricosus TaxID=182803 RepID=A0A4Y2UUJ7_ARAVE|nr:hypothetical protein AVEN_241894-1 [Araneus ventricosus]